MFFLDPSLLVKIIFGQALIDEDGAPSARGWRPCKKTRYVPIGDAVVPCGGHAQELVGGRERERCVEDDSVLYLPGEMAAPSGNEAGTGLRRKLRRALRLVTLHKRHRFRIALVLRATMTLRIAL
jgi:hypothetical protein